MLWSTRSRDDALDERAVDLQVVDWQALQVAERAVTGAEIVDRDPAAEVAQHRDLAVRLHGEAHRELLGDLEHHPIARHSVLPQHSRTCAASPSSSNAKLDKLTDSRSSGFSVPNSASARTALASTQRSMSGHEPEADRSRQERLRAHELVVGFQPQQRLVMRDLPALDMQQGLVVEHETAVVERGADRAASSPRPLPSARRASRRRCRPRRDCGRATWRFGMRCRPARSARAR